MLRIPHPRDTKMYTSVFLDVAQESSAYQSTIGFDYGISSSYGTYKTHNQSISYNSTYCSLQPTINSSKLPYKHSNGFSKEVFGLSCFQLTRKQSYIPYT